MSNPPQYDPQIIKRLQDLGIDPYKNSSPTPQKNTPKTTPQPQIQTPPSQKESTPPTTSLQTKITPPPKKNSVFPLLTISGISLLSIGSLILFKDRSSPLVSPSSLSLPAIGDQAQTQPTPTQIPKSIHHYLLTSQSTFTEATSTQATDPQKAIALLNQAVEYATQATTLFPSDYRGFEQRAKIYSSLNSTDTTESTSYLDQAIADYQKAFKLKPDNPDLTRQLATLWAKKGSVQDTLAYLNLTIQIEPTNAQHYYDLAKIQTQVGNLNEALATYQHLLPLVTDPQQIETVTKETTSLENLLAQNTDSPVSDDATPPPQPSLLKNLETAPTIQALVNTGPIIADVKEEEKIEITGQSDSNALSGTATIAQEELELIIQNEALTESSRVYTTITKGGKNLILTVKSKTNSSFTVAIDSPATEDIEFKWWITP